MNHSNQNNNVRLVQNDGFALSEKQIENLRKMTPPPPPPPPMAFKKK
jgi:hypothetical protein